MGESVGVETEASPDEIPLDPAFAAVLQQCQETQRGFGVSFQCQWWMLHAGMIQREILKPRGAKVCISRVGRNSYRSLLDETEAPIRVPQKLMRYSNVRSDYERV